MINHPHFHHKDKGCDLIQKEMSSKTNITHRLVGQFCKTHNVEVCRCGWEWGWHDGTDNRGKHIDDKIAEMVYIKGL